MGALLRHFLDYITMKQQEEQIGVRKFKFQCVLFFSILHSTCRIVGINVLYMHNLSKCNEGPIQTQLKSLKAPFTARAGSTFYVWPLTRFISGPCGASSVS